MSVPISLPPDSFESSETGLFFRDVLFYSFDKDTPAEVDELIQGLYYQQCNLVMVDDRQIPEVFPDLAAQMRKFASKAKSDRVEGAMDDHLRRWAHARWETFFKAHSDSWRLFLFYLREGASSTWIIDLLRNLHAGQWIQIDFFAWAYLLAVPLPEKPDLAESCERVLLQENTFYILDLLPRKKEMVAKGISSDSVELVYTSAYLILKHDAEGEVYGALRQETRRWFDQTVIPQRNAHIAPKIQNTGRACDCWLCAANEVNKAAKNLYEALASRDNAMCGPLLKLLEGAAMSFIDSCHRHRGLRRRSPD